MNDIIELFRQNPCRTHAIEIVTVLVAAHRYKASWAVIDSFASDWVDRKEATEWLLGGLDAADAAILRRRSDR